MTAASFALTVNAASDGRDAVAVTGEIDVTNASDLITAIDGIGGHKPLIVDLSGLRYLDSAGFAAVFQLVDQQAIVVVVDPQSPVRATAALVGLPCHDSVPALIASQQAS
jgi:anti-anti-sigma factor